jgi:cell division protein ZapA
MEDTLNRVRVVIAGEEYTIKGDASEEAINRISEYVNGKIAEVHAGMTSKERYKSVVLAAVNIAEELFESRKTLAEHSEKLDQFLFKAKELSKKLETVVQT